MINVTLAEFKAGLAKTKAVMLRHGLLDPFGYLPRRKYVRKVITQEANAQMGDWGWGRRRG